MTTTMKQDREQDDAERKAAGLPRVDERGTEPDVGAGLGFLTGAAAGAIAGPIGAIVGATLGTIVGEAAGSAIHHHDVAHTQHDRELDDAIGVTAGAIGLGAPLTFVDVPGAATFLRADHDVLEAMAQRVLEMIATNDREDVAAAITELQARVHEHLADEERELLPAYAEHAPEDAASILAEHAAFERALAELDVATDLHLLRLDAVRTFLDGLRAHAARENEGLYRWALRA